jgi:hypothetical protein
LGEIELGSGGRANARRVRGAEVKLDELQAVLETSRLHRRGAVGRIVRRRWHLSGWARLAVITVTGLAAASLATPAALADTAMISASVTPSEVALTRGARASGALLLTNSGTSRIDVHLQASGNDPSVKLTVSRPTVALAPGSSVAVIYEVTRIGEGTGQDTTVRFLLNWSQRADDGPRVRRTAVEVLKVKAAASLALIEAKIESNVTNINENRPGTAALVVSNPRDARVRLEQLQLSAPDAIDVKLTCPGGGVLEAKPGTSPTFAGCSVSVPPRSQEMLPLRFSTTDTVTPGARTVLVKVTGADSESRSQSAVASTSFTIDIFAESDILKSIGVPVFLLLPGVVIVLAAWFLIQRLSPWRQVTGDKGPGTVVSAATATALLGLAISLLLALVYPKLTAWFFPGQERNYLKAYGFRDFYYVLAYSFIIAIAFWALAFSGFYLGRWLFLPWQNDVPLALLRKLGLRGVLSRRTAYPRVLLKADPAGAQPQRGLLLGSRAGERSLVASTIAVDILDSGNTPALAAAIEDEVTESRAFDLWRTVRSAVHDKQATVSYKSGNVAAPSLVEASNLTRDGQSPGPIVEVKSGEA